MLSNPANSPRNASCHTHFFCSTLHGLKPHHLLSSTRYCTPKEEPQPCRELQSSRVLQDLRVPSLMAEKKAAPSAISVIRIWGSISSIYGHSMPSWTAYLGTSTCSNSSQQMINMSAKEFSTFSLIPDERHLLPCPFPVWCYRDAREGTLTWAVPCCHFN